MSIKFIWKVFIISSLSAVHINHVNGQEPVADIIIPPQPKNTSLNGTAVFNCTAVATSIVWKANGAVVDDGITLIVVNETKSLHMSTLRVPVSSINDATNITCTALISSPLSSNESEPALLQVQGLLGPVSNLTGTRINSTAVLISWSPPFTLEGVAILGYNVIITNSSNINVTFFIEGSITMFHYLIDFSTKTILFMMVPVNLGGLGLAAQYTFFDTSISTTTTQAAVSSTTVNTQGATSIIVLSSLSPTTAGNNQQAIIGGTIAVGLVLLGLISLAIIVSIIYFIRNRKGSYNFQNDTSLNTISDQEETLYYGVYGVATKYYDDEKRIHVAKVKVSLKKKLSERDGLITEVTRLKSMKDRNIVQLLGLVLNDEDLVILSFEFVPDGSLKEFLRSKKDSHFSGRKLTNICQQICSGMVFLHRNNRIHCRLAAQTCLVCIGEKDELIIKIAGFGRVNKESRRGSIIRKTKNELFVHLFENNDSPGIRWTAPEVLHDGKYPSAVDVWSFGILMWEIFSYCETPYPGKEEVDLYSEVKRGYRMDPPDNCPPPVFDLMKECWKYDPRERPTFTKLLTEL